MGSEWGVRSTRRNRLQNEFFQLLLVALHPPHSYTHRVRSALTVAGNDSYVILIKKSFFFWWPAATGRFPGGGGRSRTPGRSVAGCDAPGPLPGSLLRIAGGIARPSPESLPGHPSGIARPSPESLPGHHSGIARPSPESLPGHPSGIARPSQWDCPVITGRISRSIPEALGVATSCRAVTGRCCRRQLPESTGRGDLGTLWGIAPRTRSDRPSLQEASTGHGPRWQGVNGRHHGPSSQGYTHRRERSSASPTGRRAPRSAATALGVGCGSPAGNWAVTTRDIPGHYGE